METSQHVAGFASQDFVLDDSARYVVPITRPLPLTPRLTVRTKKTGGTITIEIEDNGPGIPDEIKDKILQPFFTTKKGTQGTGLGLSITNDIIKAHKGELKVESLTINAVAEARKESAGSKFIIILPSKG